MDYFVPHFGVDTDIAASLSNTKNAEVGLKHRITFPDEELPEERKLNYFVPHFGVDEDIATTQNSANWAEESTGRSFSIPEKGVSWGTNVQLESDLDREPLLSKEATPLLVHQKPAYSDYDIDYFVPNFGPDHDIAATHSNIANSEKRLNHKMNASFDDNENKLNPRDYFVPNFGMDRDIKASLKNLKDQEKIHGNWTLPPQKK